jgi:hypothetical protein
MSELRVRQLSAGGVGGERSHLESGEVGQAELRAGMGPFLRAITPPSFRPAGHVEQMSQLRDRAPSRIWSYES